MGRGSRLIRKRQLEMMIGFCKILLRIFSAFLKVLDPGYPGDGLKFCLSKETQ